MTSTETPALARAVVSDPERALAVAALRRTSMAVPTERVESLTGLDWDEMIDDLLDLSSIESRATAPVPPDRRWDRIVVAWLRRMAEPDAGIVERLTWFWHNLLTCHGERVGEGELVRTQLGLLQRESLGNFRRLLQAHTIDGATLRYLDGDGSEAHNPNENHARELMELFTVGRGAYSQDDVRAAARAMAGWRVEGDDEADDDTDERQLRVVFAPEAAFVAPLVFLGEQRDWATADIVDRLCDDPRTAERIAARLWADLVGTPLADDERAELGRWWHDHDLEILPLVDRILRSEAARTASYTRPRTGAEWFVAARVAVGREIDEPWWLEGLGQMPYAPPNVAGWPAGDHWLRPGTLLDRGGFVYDLDLDEFIRRASSTTEVLEACGIASVSPATIAALDGVDDVAELDLDQRAVTRVRLALNSPEFHLL